VIRIQRNTTATLSKTFYEDGVAVNPGTVTVTITASDGTVIAEDAATTGSGTSARTYAVTASDTAMLDSWSVAWASTGKGTLIDDYEIAGGFLFGLNQLGAVKLGQSGTIAGTYSAAQMAEVRVLVESAIEDACGVAFVPRYRVESVSGDGGTSVVLERAKVSAVRSVTVGGTAVTDVSLSPYGTLYRRGGFGRGFQNVVVGYEHGWSSPPPRVSQAAMLLARRWLVDGPIDDRATSVSMEGVGTYTLATPGMRGSYFGLPEVDQVVNQYEMNALVG
jgi:hypothetical protein